MGLGIYNQHCLLPLSSYAQLLLCTVNCDLPITAVTASKVSEYPSALATSLFISLAGLLQRRMSCCCGGAAAAAFTRLLLLLCFCCYCCLCSLSRR